MDVVNILWMAQSIHWFPIHIILIAYLLDVTAAQSPEWKTLLYLLTFTFSHLQYVTFEPRVGTILKLNIARLANAVPVTLCSKVTKQLLILLFSIVSNVISVSSVKSQVTWFSKNLKKFHKSEFFFFKNFQIFWKSCDLTLDTWDTDYIADNWEQQY